MLKELEELLRAREQVVELGPHKIYVRELASAADLPVTKETDPKEVGWLLLVRCSFDAEGKPVFTDEDIPALKASAKRRMGPLIEAVGSVNGFDVETEAKK